MADFFTIKKVKGTMPQLGRRRGAHLPLTIGLTKTTFSNNVHV